MSTIRIRARGKNFEELIESDNIVTVGDIKSRINSSDPSSVLLTYQDKILIDSTEVATLGSDCTLILESDIEFSPIEVQSPKKYKVKMENREVEVGEKDIFFKDNQAYIVTKRMRKPKIGDFLERYAKKVTRVQLLQFSFLIFIISSKNYPLLCIIAFINTLKLFSQMLLKHKVWEKCGHGAAYAIFMFFASFFAIDHGQFKSVPKAGANAK